MAGPDRPSPAGGDAVPSLSRRKRGQPGRWTSQLLLLRPRPSAWPVTSSNKLRPAASGVTAPSPGPRVLPFPPIRSGISAPPPSWPMGILSWPPSRRLSDRKPSWPAWPAICRPAAVMAGLDRPSVALLPSWPASTGHLFRQAVIFGPFCRLGGRFCPPDHHFCSFLSAWRSIFPAGPSFSAVFAGLAVIFVRQAVILGCFCWLSGRFCPSGRHFGLFLLAWRSFFPAGPSFWAVFAGWAVVFCPPGHHFQPFLLDGRSFFVRRAVIFGPFCRLECRHGRPDRLPFCSGT